MAHQQIMKTKNVITSILFIINCQLSIVNCFAQDVHFSQSYMTPLLLNPALTGVYTGDQRAFLNYKNQWRGMGAQGSAYNTSLFSYDAALMKNRWRKGYLGAGITCYRDVAGDVKIGTTQINISISGIVYITKKQFLSGGIQGGYVQKSISANAIQWESQYDQGTGAYNSSLPSNDIASIPPSTYADFSTGLSWNYNENQTNLSSNDALKINVGFAAQNINTPKQNFTGYGSYNDQLYSKFVLHGNALIGIENTNLALTPNAVFYKQGTSYELNVGTLLRWTIREESKYTGAFKGAAFSAGLQYRLNDAIVPVILLEYANYSFGISYDVNVSGLSTGTHGAGGVELSLRFLNPNPFHSALRVPEK